MCMSKCASCDERNATIYHDDDMYCGSCLSEKLIADECYCDDDQGVICPLHWENV